MHQSGFFFFPSSVSPEEVPWIWVSFTSFLRQLSHCYSPMKEEAIC